MKEGRPIAPDNPGLADPGSLLHVPGDYPELSPQVMARVRRRLLGKLWSYFRRQRYSPN